MRRCDQLRYGSPAGVCPCCSVLAQGNGAGRNGSALQRMSKLAASESLTVRVPLMEVLVGMADTVFVRVIMCVERM